MHKSNTYLTGFFLSLPLKKMMVGKPLTFTPSTSISLAVASILAMVILSLPARASPSSS